MPASFCPDCGAPLPRGLGGLCPRCLWADSTESGGSSLLPGHAIGPELARGGMGIVYSARQFSPARVVAVKMLRPHLLEQAEMKERFRQEAQAAAALQHPGILSVYQVGETDGVPWFTMMLAEGGTLADRRAKFVGKWRESAALIAGLARAVGHAHERGVLHRDLKPGNILFDGEGRAYVCDFGLAKVATVGDTTPDWTLSVQLLGTPHYLPPEVADGTLKLSTTAGDIYALGVILYELLAGHLPFDAENVPALLRKIADEDPSTPGVQPVAKPPVASHSETGSNQPAEGSALIGARSASPQDEVPAGAGWLQPVSERRATGGRATGAPPRDLSAIAMNCLEKSPARRYATCMALADDLEAWLAGKPVTARRLSRRQKFGRWVQRNPVVAGLTALLAAAIITGGIVVTRKNKQLTSALGEAQVNLRGSFISEARLRQASGDAGQRWETLDLLKKAAASGPVTDEITDLAATALGTADLVTIQQWEVPEGVVPSFSADLTKWIGVNATEDGVAARDTATGKEIRRFPGPAGATCTLALWAETAQRLVLVFSDKSAAVWDLDGPQPVKEWPAKTAPRKITITADGTKIATWRKGDAEIISLTDGSTVAIKHTMSEWPNFVSLSPDGEWVVLSDPLHTQCFDARSGVLKWENREACFQAVCCWSADSRRFGYNRKEAQNFGIFRAESGLPVSAFNAHRSVAQVVQFAGQSVLAISASAEGMLRIWDQRDGRELLRAPAYHKLARLSPQGDRIAWMPEARRVAVSEIRTEYFREHGQDAASSEQGSADALNLAPDGKTIFARKQGRLMGWLTGQNIPPVKVSFLGLGALRLDSDSGSKWVYTSDGSGLSYRLPAGEEQMRLASGKALSALLFGELLKLPTDCHFEDFTDSGVSWIIRTNAGNIEVWPGGRPAGKRVLLNGESSQYRRMSCDGKWMATIPADKSALVLHDGGSGAEVTRFAMTKVVSVRMSRDSRWVVAKSPGGWQTWRTGTWQPGPVFTSSAPRHSEATYFISDDGLLFIAQTAGDTMSTFDLPSGRLRHRLRSPISMDIESTDYDVERQLLWLLSTGGRLYRWDLKALEAELTKLGLARPAE